MRVYPYPPTKEEAPLICARAGCNPKYKTAFGALWYGEQAKAVVARRQRVALARTQVRILLLCLKQ